MSVRIKWPLKIQVERSARALTNGEAILATVRRHRSEIVDAAARGFPPVSAVSGTLKDQFPEEMTTAPARQFVGTAVKALLLSEGFELYQSGVRLPRDPVFTTGSIYRRATKENDPAKRAVREAFARMVRGLSVGEKRLLLDVVQKSLGEDEDNA